MVFELLASSTPSILIPSPNVANNHQYYNAKNLADQKLAIMIEEDNLDSDGSSNNNILSLSTPIAKPP